MLRAWAFVSGSLADGASPFRPACAVTCASPPTWYKGPERPLPTDHIHQRADTGLHSAATCSDHPALKDVAAGAPREAAGMPPPPGARASQDTGAAPGSRVEGPGLFLQPLGPHTGVCLPTVTPEPVSSLGCSIACKGGHGSLRS